MRILLSVETPVFYKHVVSTCYNIELENKFE